MHKCVIMNTSHKHSSLSLPPGLQQAGAKAELVQYIYRLAHCNLDLNGLRKPSVTDPVFARCSFVFWCECSS